MSHTSRESVWTTGGEEADPNRSAGISWQRPGADPGPDLPPGFDPVAAQQHSMELLSMRSGSMNHTVGRMAAMHMHGQVTFIPECT
jgi:hypothetical protein